MRKKHDGEITGKMIAEEAGVSASTVSRVLNEQQVISPAIRQKVIEVAHRLGYTKWRERGRRNVLLITPEFKYDFYCVSLVGFIRTELLRNGFSMEIVMADDCEMAQDRLFCGAISLAFKNHMARSWAIDKSIPLVCVNDFSYHLGDVYSVASDDHQAMAFTVAYLYERGHRRIGMFSMGRSDNFNHRRRAEGFREQMTARELTPQIQLWNNTGFERMLADKVTAIIHPFEAFAAPLMHRLHLAGKRVPEDISVISWELELSSQFLHPPQTSMAQDFPVLARRAVTLLRQLMDREKVNDQLVEYKFYERASVASI